MMWGNKFIKNLFSIVISVEVVIVAASFISAKVINEKDEMDVSSSFSIPDVPSKVSFAGETIELNRYDLYERYERELTATCYMHSTTLLTLKRANRYMPVIEPILKKTRYSGRLYIPGCHRKSFQSAGILWRRSGRYMAVYAKNSASVWA